MRARRYEPGGREPGWTASAEKMQPLEAADPLAAQLDQFFDLIAGKAKPIITPAYALQSLRAVEAVRCSMAIGKTVALQGLTDSETK